MNENCSTQEPEFQRDAHLSDLRSQAIEAIEMNDADELENILMMVDEHPRVLNIPSESEWNWSLLEHAISDGSIECARVLAEFEIIDPARSRQSDGIMPAHFVMIHASSMRHEKAMKFINLLESAGADFNAKDSAGWTPLHHAIHCGESRIAQYLMGRGVWVDPKLISNRAMQKALTPADNEPWRQDAINTLRLVRSLAMERNILAAMPADGEAPAKPSTGMTL